MYSLRFTGILIVILVVPLLLRLRDLEPYPAALFPSGPGVLKLSNNAVSMPYRVILGLRPSGKWEEIETKSFLKPASLQNLTPLLNINFGFGVKEKPKHGKFTFIKDLLNFNRPVATAEDELELKQWLNSRLKKQGYLPNYIKVYSCVNTISTLTGAVVSKKILNEKTIAFAK